MTRRTRLALVVACVTFILCTAASLWVWRAYVGPGPLTEFRAVVIPKGAGVARIADLLAARGVIADRRVFMAGARLSGVAKRLRAGEFAFPAHASVADVARHLAFGQPVMRRVTIAEGLTSAQALALVAQAEGLEGAAPPVEEGAILPETYLYTWGDSRPDMVARMQKAMADVLASLWPQRAPDVVVTSPREALILASIIEKETAIGAERPMISAVFQNRLRSGMKLQSDPTVLYALTNGKGALERRLTHADLDTASPYNTYVTAGLPPGPIGNPGRASIEAALHPATSDALYFVADGTGGHVFARTLDEHNRNVARWRRLQP